MTLQRYIMLVRGGLYQYGGQGEGKHNVDDKLSDVLIRSLEC